MIGENYKCDGQIDLISYLEYLSKQTEKCSSCIYFKDFKCVREKCHRLKREDGWNPLWYKCGHVFGNWPTCNSWLPVETISEGKSIYICEGEAKDKTFKWPKDTEKKFKDNVIAWRYKGDIS